MEARLSFAEERTMQVKGFLLGMAVASLLWLAVPAIAERGVLPQVAAAQQAVVVHAGAEAMTAEERQAHAAEMHRLWQSMTPAQREAHRGMMSCPYAGNAQHGKRSNGQAGGQGPTHGLQPAREPLGT
jgi:hypothetical protein